MKTKSYLLLTVLMVFSTLAVGQTIEPMIVFDEAVHDYGTINEADGPATTVFNFTNTGQKPLIIKHASASCGCTKPEYTKEPVGPGKSGFIKVTYNPKNRPGKFTKSITVTSNAVEPIKRLQIKGDVKPRPRTIADVYPFQMGPLRLKNSHVSFTKIKSGAEKTVKVIMANSSESEPLIVSFLDVPKHITISPEKVVINPNMKKEVSFTYNSEVKNDWGFILDYIRMDLNGVKDSKNRLTISATVEEDFSKLSEDELAKAPKIEVDNTSFDFGTITSGDKVEHMYKITNTGKSDLIIRKVKSSCGCTAVLPSSKVIHPGETSDLKTVFNSRGKKGRQYKSVTVITNAPESPTTTLRIGGMIEQQQ